MGIITNMRSRMQVVMWTILVLFITSMVIGGLVGGASITDIFGKRSENEVGSLNGKPILFEDFNRMVLNEINRLDAQSTISISDQDKEYIRAVVWERLIADLIIQEQIENNSIKVSDEEVLFQLKNNPPSFLKSSPAFQTNGEFDFEKYFESIMNPNQFDWRPIEVFLKEVYLPNLKLESLISSSAGLSNDQILKDYKKRFLKYKIEALHVTEKSLSEDFEFKAQNIITENEISKFYEENIQEYFKPEMRNLKYVSWPINPSKNDTLRVKLEAENLLFKLKNGESFAELANKFSEDPYNQSDPNELKGGYLGWFGKGAMVPEFDIAFESNIDDIVGPILTKFGFHLIRINDKRNIENGDLEVNASHILLSINAGIDTQKTLVDEANFFSLEAQEFGFFEHADSLGLEIYEANEVIKESIFINEIGVARPGVNFAFKNDVGSVSNAFKNDKFVNVFYLNSISKESFYGYDEKKEEIKKQLLSEFKSKEIKKLADSIKKDYISNLSLKSIYEKNNTFEYTAETSSTLGGSFKSIGKSNYLVGALENLEEGDMIGPIPTLRGQAFVKLISIDKIDMEDYQEKKEYITYSLLNSRQNEVWSNWLQALKNNSDIKDYRYDFY